MDSDRSQPLAAPPSTGGRVQLDKSLRLLGLLLNRTSKTPLPCAVVQPQRSPVKIASGGAPDSPQKLSPIPILAEEEKSPPRKRRRDEVGDISETDKREKRKIVNRVAAQNARDRRKRYVEDLERKLALLEDKNEQLSAENVSLRQRSECLEGEKRELEQQLAISPLGADSLLDLQALVKESLLESAGSAAPASLQQKQISATFLTQVWMIRLMCCWLASAASTPHPSPRHVTPSEDHVSPVMPPDHLLRLPVWWGTAQTTWTPPRN